MQMPLLARPVHSLAALVVLVGLTSAAIPCHYCGHQDLCPLPYIDRSRPESEESVKLKKMCPKVEGCNDSGIPLTLTRL